MIWSPWTFIEKSIKRFLFKFEGLKIMSSSGSGWVAMYTFFFYKKQVYKKLDPTKAKFPYVKSFLISVFYTNSSVGLPQILSFL